MTRFAHINIENYYINYRDVNQMGEILEIWPEDVKINVKMAVEHIGIKKTIDAVGLKEVIDTVGLKEVIDTVGLKEILKLYSKAEINAILKDIEKI